MPSNRTSYTSRPGFRIFGYAAAILALLYLSTGAFHLYKPLPDGLDVATPWRPVHHIEFLADSTWIDESGRQHTEREIFDGAFAMIEQAHSRVVTDFFLVNQFAGSASGDHRPLSRQFVDHLVERRKEPPEIEAVLITDPFNTLYGGVSQDLFDDLRSADVSVIETDLTRLRDSNPVWSAAWRICCQWFGNSVENGWLPNPVGDTEVGLRTYLRLANFKANHRKTLVADTPGGWSGLVTSANPHDASSRHDNVAIQFTGPSALDLLDTELAVARFSGGSGISVPAADDALQPDSPLEIRILTESRIRDAALEMINQAGRGDRLDLLMFYLSHRGIIRAFKRAAERGVDVRVLLDPNEDAFGRKKNGIPNRQVAMELTRAGIPVRWCNTRGEQCHGKMLIRYDGTGDVELLVGSANFTRRNLDNFNLETNVEVRADAGTPVMEQVSTFFEVRWNNEPDRIHSLPYEAHADHSRLRYWRYRFMEATGLSTF